MGKLPSILFTIFISILPLATTAQEWIARYNGTGNSEDWVNAIAVDGTGAVYVTGRSYGSGTAYDYVTVKYDPAGVEQWVACYNDPENGTDEARAIAISDDGSIYVTGESHVIIGSDYVTIKYDSVGTEQWVARYTGPGDMYDGARAITVDGMGSIYVTGDSYGPGTDYDYATVKYDSAGVEQWSVRYNGPDNSEDIACAIAVDGNGAVYVTGWSAGSGSSRDYATVKYDSTGIEQWVARYNGTGNSEDWAQAITIDDVGSVYVTGYSTGSGTEYDYATVKYDSAGVEQWVARYNSSENEADEARAVVIADDNAVYVTGGSYDGIFSNYVTIKYDCDGTEQWVACYDGPDNGYDYANAIAVDESDAIYVTGVSYSVGTYFDYATVKYDSSGVEQWVARYNGPGNFDDMAAAIVIDEAGNIIIAGRSTGIGTSIDYTTIKYLPVGIEEQRVPQFNTNNIRTTIFSGPLQLPEGRKCKVFDITGRVVMLETMKPGVYFIEVDGEITSKVVKVK